MEAKFHLIEFEEKILKKLNEEKLIFAKKSKLEKVNKISKLLSKVEMDLNRIFENPLEMKKQLSITRDSMALCDFSFTELIEILELDELSISALKNTQKLYHHIIKLSTQMLLENAYFYLRKQNHSNFNEKSNSFLKVNSINEIKIASGLINKTNVNIDNSNMDEDKIDAILLNKKRILNKSRTSQAFECLQDLISYNKNTKNKEGEETTIYMKSLEEKYKNKEIKRIKQTLKDTPSNLETQKNDQLLELKSHSSLSGNNENSENEEDQFDSHVIKGKRGSVFQMKKKVDNFTEPDSSIFDINMINTLLESYKNDIKRHLEDKESLKETIKILERKIERHNKHFKNELEIVNYENLSLNKIIDNHKLEEDYLKKEIQTFKQKLEKKKSKIMSLKEDLIKEREKIKIKEPSKIIENELKKRESKIIQSSIYEDYSKLMNLKKETEDRLNIALRKNNSQDYTIKEITEKLESLQNTLSIELKESENLRIAYKNLEQNYDELIKEKLTKKEDKTFQVDTVHNSDFVKMIVDHSLPKSSRSSSKKPGVSLKSSKTMALKHKSSIALASPGHSRRTSKEQYDIISEGNKNSLLNVDKNSVVQKTYLLPSNSEQSNVDNLKNSKLGSNENSELNFSRNNSERMNVSVERTKKESKFEFFRELFKNSDISEKNKFTDFIMSYVENSNPEQIKNLFQRISNISIEKDKKFNLAKSNNSSLKNSEYNNKGFDEESNKSTVNQKSYFLGSNSTKSQKTLSNMIKKNPNYQTNGTHRHSKSTLPPQTNTQSINNINKSISFQNSEISNVDLFHLQNQISLDNNLKEEVMERNISSLAIKEKRPSLLEFKEMKEDKVNERISNLFQEFIKSKKNIMDYFDYDFIPKPLKQSLTTFINESSNIKNLSVDIFKKIIESSVEFHKENCGGSCKHLINFYKKIDSLEKKKSFGKNILNPHKRNISKLPNLKGF